MGVAESGFNNSFSPLVFVRLVGFSAADGMRLMKAAQRMNETVRWRLAPPGVMADVYLAHANSIRSGPKLQHSGNPMDSSFSDIGAYEHSTLHLDAIGEYKTCPVWVLGRPSAPLQGTPGGQLASLVFPDALRDLGAGLRKMEADLVSQRILYALGSFAWEQREYWKTHRLQLTHNARLIASIVPQQWQVHLHAQCTVTEVDQAAVQIVPQSSGFAAEGFDVLPLENALWEFAKRCPEGLLAKMVPSVYLTDRLTHRRTTTMSPRTLGDHCTAVLRLLDTGSRNAQELEQQLRISRPALLRTMACLALIRAIHPEPRARGLWYRLTKRWRTKLGNISGW